MCKNIENPNCFVYVKFDIVNSLFAKLLPNCCQIFPIHSSLCKHGLCCRRLFFKLDSVTEPEFPKRVGGTILRVWAKKTCHLAGFFARNRIGVKGIGLGGGTCIRQWNMYSSIQHIMPLFHKWTDYPHSSHLCSYTLLNITLRSWVRHDTSSMEGSTHRGGTSRRLTHRSEGQVVERCSDEYQAVARRELHQTHDGTL